MPAGTVITSVKDVIAVVINIFESAKHEIVFITPDSVMNLAGNYETMQSAELFIKNGGTARGIVPILRDNVERVRKRLDFGEDLRHSDRFHEVFLCIGDKQQSISAINLGVQEYTLDTPVTAFWSDSPAYAEYLLTSFENVWSEAVPAEVRIKELLEQG
jgi:adenylosuccinate synthase